VETSLAASVKTFKAKVASTGARLQERFDSDSDAENSKSLLTANFQALEAKIADLSKALSRNPKLKCLMNEECLGGQRGGGGQG